LERNEVRFDFRFRIPAMVILLCLAACAVHAQQSQQGDTAARPSPLAPNGNVNAPAAPGGPILGSKASEREVDNTVPNDSAMDALIAPYSAKVRELDATIGKLTSELKKEGMGGGALGNFVADAMRDRAQVKLGKPVLLAITNSGGLRKNEIAPGELKASDIFELLPFENALVTLDLTGEQLRRFLDVVVSHRDAEAGARIIYRTNDQKKSEIVTVKLSGGSAEKEIDPQATYTIVTIDYLVKRGGDYSVLQEARNVRPLNLSIRDAVVDYVKAETAAGRDIKAKLDGRFHAEEGAGNKTEGKP
jgi:2',3'-cyclic-nucleotide 2'-phosphodiesterase (5'-nucleotidase family)